MSIFSFIKLAGESIFGGKNEEEELVAKKAAAEANELAEEAAMARRLEETIRDLSLDVEGLTVFVDDDRVSVSGEAHDQATKEKVVLVLGNSTGVASVEDNMTVEHTEPEAQFHTVVSGDSLSKIAKHYYGDPMKYTLIFEANQPMLKDPNLIYPGQVLRIPRLD
ncbi:peptidoglycan-binding protein LysM [Ichthyenterobacterium sp. W332]|uniref:Peptidoglycan-binding protein LysM n=1 Tax=Microcosmobacter mediterraneus TaxID=3075607 RepID=A0ABU2YJ67_9FLAO|nr:peptidoglycan-binding protein LysM [Ichthyenterobacterium sp. W332]MDT0558217.1 peptidoglycan-binding protein LysM [Ichthyenterobacterium sp. W332]